MVASKILLELQNSEFFCRSLVMTLIYAIFNLSNFSALSLDFKIINFICISPFQLRPATRAYPFFSLDGNFPGAGFLSSQIPRGGDERKSQMPRPPSKMQHFSFIAPTSSTIF